MRDLESGQIDGRTASPEAVRERLRTLGVNPIGLEFSDSPPEAPVERSPPTGELVARSRAKAAPLRSPFALQAIEYAGSLCLDRPELADVLFHWAAEHAGNGSASHASVVQGCVKQLDDGQAAKLLIHAALEATKDKAARLELATAAFSVGDVDKASVWISLASDTAVRGSACRELVANAAHIPPSLKADTTRVLERHKALLQELRISAEDYEAAIALLRDE